MAGINKVILVGNLGAKPEVKYGSTGNAMTNLSVATSESWTDVEYNPIAKPRLSSVAILDISEGNIASIALKAIKNSVSKIENVR
jgi:hypothetical protein